MRKIKIESIEDENLLDKWIIAEWSEFDDILEGIDRDLALHGLELVIGDADDSNIYVRVEKREIKE